MKTVEKKVYYCDHCKRHMLSAGAMSRHEKYCRLNPNNRHKCFDLCTHLKRVLLPYSFGEMVCKVTDCKMYSYKLEKRASLFPYHNLTKGLVRMPLTCNLYKVMTLEEEEKRFGEREYYD
jgi:hypothetical protein